MLSPNFLCVVTPDLRHKLQVIVNLWNSSIIVLYNFLFPKPTMLLKHGFPVYVATLGKMMFMVSVTQLILVMGSHFLGWSLFSWYSEDKL